MKKYNERMHIQPSTISKNNNIGIHLDGIDNNNGIHIIYDGNNTKGELIDSSSPVSDDSDYRANMLKKISFYMDDDNINHSPSKKISVIKQDGCEIIIDNTQQNDNINNNNNNNEHNTLSDECNAIQLTSTQGETPI